MRTIAVIPARYHSTRLPQKMLASLGNKTLVRTTYENIRNMGLFEEVLVATDHPEIFQEITLHGGKAVMSAASHQTGSDRIAEVIRPLEYDLIINVQGDEPFMGKAPLEKLIQVFSNSSQSIDVATLKMKITETEEIQNPNNVKVVCDQNDFALYFSRSPIPYLRDQDFTPNYYQHIGVYAFTKKALLSFSQLPMSPNEESEKIECLRYLENGMRIKVLETQEKTMGIDTAEDLAKANRFLLNT